MSTIEDLGIDKIVVDINNLYRDELITDRKVVQLRRMIPVTSTGELDAGRKTIYVGSTQIMLPTGALPVNAEIDAESLEEALIKFPATIKKTVEEMFARAEALQREEAKRIVTPDEFAGKNNGGIII